jgi:archaeosortase A (PGF-CTERM-specific)
MKSAVATADPLIDSLLFVAIGLLGAGFLWNRRETHLLRAVGWTAMGIYWWLQIPSFLADADTFNAFAAGLALPAFMFLAYHEILSHKWKEEYPPLKFVAGAAFLAGAAYLLVDRVPYLSGGLIKLVADHTAGVLNLFGLPYQAGELELLGNPLWYRTNFEEIYVTITLSGVSVVQIVLACSALQAMVVAFGFIMGTSADLERKGLALLVTIPPIYVLNLVRNVVIIFLYNDSNLDFEIAHGIAGKAISLFSLVVLVLLAFYILPEMYQNINGLLELAWRKGPGHDYLFMSRKEKPAADPLTTEKDAAVEAESDDEEGDELG